MVPIPGPVLYRPLSDVHPRCHDPPQTLEQGYFILPRWTLMARIG
ncbi:hypothetical protein GbCGDNIH3_5113 [Granulibacter bethesdensis]|uniref:Uncharacterized protein n=1 Tax=Granulibacter bethesdensis TaxID=364410 RepID=A0AAN0RG77_9PROT|nr:hypothetical protein GbCGDNIH3_5113 [Granulibacter bethesdensis]